MGVTALQSLLVYGQRPPIGSGASGSNNPDLCPSAFWGGVGYIDGRVGYNVTRLGAIMANGSPIVALDQVPSTISAVNIAASQAPTTAVALTLVSATGAGVTVLSADTQVWASGNTVASGSLALDGAPALVSFGVALPSTGTTRVSAYDPTAALARNVRITTNGNDTSGTYTVAGYDVYGYAMTETITGVNNAVASGKKAFKFITSVTPGGTINSTLVTVGTGDVIGLPMRVDRFAYARIVYNDTVITASTGFVAAVTSTATATTGDTRGTYALQSASDAAKRIQIFIQPAVANVNSLTGMWGVTQA